MPYQIHVGDCAEWLSRFEAESYDAILTDPPYGLRFMGKAWDYDVPRVEFWREALRVLKPGGHVLAFSGTRTYHRMVVAIEDAGFEIRDCLMWVYATGFPKSLQIDKAIDDKLGAERAVIGMGAAQCEYLARGEPCSGHGDAGKSQSGATIHVPLTAPGSPEAAHWEGWGTALKPALEPVCLAMKPLDGTFAENALTHGVAGINIDGCRIATPDGQPAYEYPNGPKGNVGKHIFELAARHTPVIGDERGRWPANLLLDEGAASLLDLQSGDRQGGRPIPANTNSRPIWGNAAGRQPFAGYDDSGGASRFFFVAKPTSWERNFGCEELPLRTAGEVTDREEESDGLNSPRAGAGRTSGNRNFHPTIKPITLTKYLATMLLPPAGRERRLLVPFAGSGSEMIGALRAGWEHITGIEMDPEYAAIAMARLARWREVPAHLEVDDIEKRAPEDARQGRLF